jgi:Tfp pilus assembly protein PilN
MLRTNLSTRPFYNVRAVRAVIIGLSTIVAVATAYNVVELARLTTQQRSLSADAVKAEAEAGRLTREAAQVRARIDQTEIDSVAAAAREANAIIDRRAFSWTTLFARFESALPTDVRITAVQPRREADGTFALSVAVQSRRIEAVDAFIEALEALGTFKNVLPVEEQTTEDGLIEAVLDGQYFPDPPAAPASAAGEGALPPPTTRAAIVEGQSHE